MTSLELAIQLLASKNFSAALDHAEQVLREQPDNRQALWISALSHFNTGRLPGAVDRSNRLSDLLEKDGGNNLQPLMLLGMAASQLGRLDQARGAFQAFLSQQPGNVGVLAILSRLAYAQGDRGAAESTARKLFDLLPELSDQDFANPLLEFGKTLYECSLLASQEDAKQWLDSVQAIVPLLERVGAASDFSFHFGMAKLHEAGGNAGQALGYYRRGNALQRSLSGYQIEQDLAALAQTREDYGQAYFDKEVAAGVKAGDPAGIFILGMPRSGSSLVEQILAAHSGVCPCGERTWLHDAFRDALVEAGNTRGQVPRPVEFDQALFERVRAGYFERADFPAGVKCFTDKMPGNIYKLGLLLKAFPDAKVIFTHRDKFATVMSCYTTAFAAGLEFTESLQDCARMYDETCLLADYWEGFAGERMYRMNYRTLVTDLRNTVAELLQFAGLDWETACLEPHRVQRAVGTSSTMQVKEPVYQQADTRWEVFRDHLGDDKPLF